MSDDSALDYYEVLQISPNADPDTIHRVYRLLAQRFHPDNQQTGNAERFRDLTDAYHALADPESRARYDLLHRKRRHDHSRLILASVRGEGDFADERFVRLSVLETLYTRRRVEPQNPGIFDIDLAGLVGRPREHLEFTLWYLTSKLLVKRGDQSQLQITAEGVDYLEKHHDGRMKAKLLKAAS